MNLHFKTTGQMTDNQSESIDAALRQHNIDVPDGGGYGGFDWLCERIEQDLGEYIETKDLYQPQSRADAITDIERLRYALKVMGGGSEQVIRETADYSHAAALFRYAGLQDQLSKRLEEIEKTGKGALGEIPDSLIEWEAEYCDRPIYYLFDLAWYMLCESCEIALSDEPPLSVRQLCTGEGGNIVEANTASTKGGRPKDLAKQELVRKLADAFRTATGRRASYTEAGPFDDFLSACLAIIEAPKDGASNRKLIRNALEHVPKPRRKN